MTDILKGVFLGVCFFVIPLTVWVIRTGVYETQTAQILAHLQKRKKITSWEAIERYGITRLAAVIAVLKDSHNIVSIRMTDKATGKWWAEYRYMGAK